MKAKPLVRQFNVLVNSADDLATLNRLLVACTINQRFRTSLLADPKSAIQSGFGGELFSFSQDMYHLLTTIRAHSLPDFVNQLGEMGVVRLA